MKRAPRSLRTWDADVVDDLYKFHASHTISWHEKSRSLLFAAKGVVTMAEVTARDLDARGKSLLMRSQMEIALGLLGRAYEVCFKGLLVANQPNLVGQSGLAKRGMPGHNLEALAKQTCSYLNPIHLTLLRRLNPYVVWVANYPTPKQRRNFEIQPLDQADFELGAKILEDLLLKTKAQAMKQLEASGQP